MESVNKLFGFSQRQKSQLFLHNCNESILGARDMTHAHARFHVELYAVELLYELLKRAVLLDFLDLTVSALLRI